MRLIWAKQEIIELSPFKLPLRLRSYRPTYVYCIAPDENVFWSGYVPIQPSVRPCATNPWYIWMPLLNSNKPYQFHIEARPTNSYAYFYEPIRTCPFFYQESSWSAILLFLLEDTRVVLRSCPYLCRGTDIPQHT